MDVSIKIDSKAIQKLISVAASGVGAVAAPWVTRPAAKAKADEIRILAQGRADAEAIARGEKFIDDEGRLLPIKTTPQNEIGHEEGELQNRLEFQELKRQRNLQKIVRGAAEEIEGHDEEVSDEEVDEDWIASFFELSRDVTSDEMQKLWSRILAGEVKNPGSFSIRTIDTLKKISKKEAEQFQLLDQFLIDDFIFNRVEIINKYTSIGSNDLLNLDSLGLINFKYALSVLLRNTLTDPNRFPMIDERGFKVIFKSDKSLDGITISAITLTKVGGEIMKVVDRSNISKDYLRNLAKYTNSLGITLSIARSGPDGLIEEEIIAS